MATLYKRGGTYYIQFSKDGKQVRKSLKTSSPSTARQIQKEIEKQLALGTYNATDAKDCSIEAFREFSPSVPSPIAETVEVRPGILLKCHPMW